MRALITGITGQDGSYLAELLLSKGYEVAGMVRRSSQDNLGRIEHLRTRLHMVQGDLLDANSLEKILRDTQPHEVFNLAAQSFVPTSWEQPILTGEFTALGVTRLLEAVRAADRNIRFYQASSSEMFGKVREVPQRETTPFHPRSPYGVSKVYGHYITINARESYGLFAVSGILFNHESPRRGKEFVTRKITRTAAAIRLGLADRLELGNLDARRDWGYADDYVDAMWRMLQQDEAEDYVIATGETHSVREFCELAFGCVGLNYQDHVRTNPKLVRPAEVDLLVGDATKARTKLDWEPKVRFRDLVQMMVEADLADLQRGTSDFPRALACADRRADMTPVVVAPATAPKPIQV
ncbi:GDP-mannose 4,6-dehydratase [bacterium]|nr:GDP-mannose 4,6-dehydratase [bacterium]